MSLGVVIKGPEGVVLACDSRVTLEAVKKGMAPLPVNFDNATKLLGFSEPNNFVGAVTYGAAVIGSRTAHSFVPEIEEDYLPKKSVGRTKKNGRITVKEYSEILSKFFSGRWKESMPMPPDYKGLDMTFVVGGYDSGEPYGRVFLFKIPSDPEPKEQHAGKDQFGMTWGGQLQIASRIVHGFDPALIPIIKNTLKLNDQDCEKVHKALRANLRYPIPYKVLPLQDCIDLAIFLVRSTIIAQHLAIGIRGVGGFIDVAYVTRTNGLTYVQQKKVHGEQY